MVNQPVLLALDRLSEDAKKLMHPFVPGHGIWCAQIFSNTSDISSEAYFIQHDSVSVRVGLLLLVKEDRAEI